MHQHVPRYGPSARMLHVTSDPADLCDTLPAQTFGGLLQFVIHKAGVSRRHTYNTIAVLLVMRIRTTARRTP